MIAKDITILGALEDRTRPDGEMCMGFGGLVTGKITDLREIRRIVRRLARKGYAEYHRGLWTEGGMPAGAGYCITRPGRAALAHTGAGGSRVPISVNAE